MYGTAWAVDALIVAQAEIKAPVSGKAPPPRKAIHLSVPYLDNALSPAAASTVRAIRDNVPRLVREDLGQTIAGDNRDVRAAAKAVARYERAADQGYVMAHYNLGRALAEGAGVKRDFRRASENFSTAARLGNVPAMLRLAEFHLAGLGTPKDRVEALALYYVAASIDEQGAARARSLLALHLSHAQLEQARERAREIRAQMPRVDLVLQRTKEQDLLAAAANGDLDTVNSLIKEGVDANAINSLGRTGIIAAAWRGHYEVVKSLLEAGVDINAVDNQRGTALTWASVNGHPKIVELLLRESALIDARDTKGATPLIRAAWNGHDVVVKLLVDAGADVNAVDDSGNTAMDRATSMNERDIITILQSGPKRRGTLSMALLEDDDSSLGALAVLGHDGPGQDIIVDRANQLLQIGPGGGVQSRIATREELEALFGSVLTDMPPDPTKGENELPEDWLFILIGVLIALAIAALIWFFVFR
ncbi:MAG: ankyrin repeat domain-containing protein [Alphaproteobacteria bacterium]|nr:ankyrin repeat domain-containing protein [Alphaproteobacteria bacterium]